MLDVALISKTGGRDNNEDYILKAVYENQECFVLCDGLGGHEKGEIASKLVANIIGEMFEKAGDYPSFLTDSICYAQKKMLELQNVDETKCQMKTTLVVLVVTDEIVKWAHIGDSRLYHFYDNATKYQRTKDHSMAQILCSGGEIKEQEIRHHSDRNKLTKVMGAVWEKNLFELSPMIELDGSKKAFALMSDGFWEYLDEEEMMECLRETKKSKEWLEKMQAILESRINIKECDNYSAICVRL